MRTVLMIAWKDLLLLRRDTFGLFWLLAFPLIFALFFGTIFGGSGGSGSSKMKIAIVDLDQSDVSAQFMKSLIDSGSITLLKEVDAVPMTEDLAKDLVRKGDATAAVVIPKNFGGSPFQVFSGDGPELRVGMDPSRRAEAGMLQGLLTKASFERMSSVFQDPKSLLPDIERERAELAKNDSINLLEKAALSKFYDSMDTFFGTFDALPKQGDGSTISNSFEPVKIAKLDISRDQRRPASPFEISFPQSMVWALIGCAAGFAIALVQERTMGTWQRLLAAPVTTGQILMGKGLSCFLACLFTLSLMLTLGHLFFSVRFGSPPLLAIAVLSSAFCFSGLMMVISTMGRTERAVAGAGWAAMMPFAMLGGAMVPLFVMPEWMQKLGSISPVKWAILSLEGAIWRGFRPSEMLLPVGILLTIGTVGFVFGLIVLRRRALA